MAASSKSNPPKRIATTRRTKMAAQPESATKSNASKRRKIVATASSAKNPNPKKRRITKTWTTCSSLPDDLWESIFKSFNYDRLTFKCLSVVSKQFLSITNRLRFSVTITDETIPYLPRLFHRFPNLTSLDLTSLSQSRDLGTILTEISTFNFDLRKLSCNSMAANGLLALSKTMKNVKSFSYTPLFPFTRRMGSIKKSDILFIVDCFPSLEKFTLTYPAEYSRQVDRWFDHDLKAVFI